MSMLWLRLRIALLRLVLRPSEWICLKYSNLVDELVQRFYVPPGTRVRITCDRGCGNGLGTDVVWTIERLTENGDYWMGNKELSDSTFAPLECFEVIDVDRDK